MDNLLELNQAWSKISRHSLEELKINSFFSFVHAEDVLPNYVKKDFKFNHYFLKSFFAL